MPEETNSESVVKEEPEVIENEEIADIDSEKWLYGSLMLLVAVGYIHLLMFTAILVVMFG